LGEIGIHGPHPRFESRYWNQGCFYLITVRHLDCQEPYGIVETVRTVPNFRDGNK